jgi:hypothetical protein
VYLATVIDCSRRLLDYAIGPHHDAGLVIAALRTAAATHRGDGSGYLEVLVILVVDAW